MLFCHLMINLMGLSLGKNLPFLHLLQVVQGTSISCTKMQWVLFATLENQISFATFTCNPRWQEITDALLPGPNCRKLPRYCCKSLQVEVEIPST